MLVGTEVAREPAFDTARDVTRDVARDDGLDGSGSPDANCGQGRWGNAPKEPGYSKDPWLGYFMETPDGRRRLAALTIDVGLGSDTTGCRCRLDFEAVLLGESEDGPDEPDVKCKRSGADLDKRSALFRLCKPCPRRARSKSACVLPTFSGVTLSDGASTQGRSRPRNLSFAAFRGELHAASSLSGASVLRSGVTVAASSEGA